MSRLTKAAMMGAAGGAAGALGIEDVFSTWLYTGNGSTQTITNGIDLAGEGGLVWTKGRSVGYNNALVDTERGGNSFLSSNLTGSETTNPFHTFLSDGYTLPSYSNWNANNTTYASWTFRKAPGFFDVVTYTGDGSSSRNIAHSLGSTPGMIFVKNLDTISDWYVYSDAISFSYQDYLKLNSAAAKNSVASGTFDGSIWAGNNATSTVFSVGSSLTNTNNNRYVAYLFAHDEAIFGENADQSVIKCGSYTGNGSSTGPVVNLGWEPQWVLIKAASQSGNWVLFDTMRGIPTDGNDALLGPNLSDAEETVSNWLDVNATGFQPRVTFGNINTSGATYVYIAIRRGPMKTPTDATTVFDVQQGVVGNGYAGTPELQGLSIGFPPDMTLGIRKNSTTDLISGAFVNNSRLTSGTYLEPRNTNAESSGFDGFVSYGYAQTDIAVGDIGGMNDNLFRGLYYNFRRAPGFFDVVAYNGSSSAQNIVHNLGVVPELIWVKRRSSLEDWATYHSSVGASKDTQLNEAFASYTNVNMWDNTTPTSSVFRVGTDGAANAAGETFIAYLFATLPGISKVGSYTGTAATLNVDCGFTAGARFVLIKRTDSTGDWYVWDTVRGIVSGNDPYVILTSTAEVTTTDYIDPYSAGFTVTSSAPAAINASGGSYIFLAIA